MTPSPRWAGLALFSTGMGAGVAAGDNAAAAAGGGAATGDAGSAAANCL